MMVALIKYPGVIAICALFYHLKSLQSRFFHCHLFRFVFLADDSVVLSRYANILEKLIVSISIQSSGAKSHKNLTFGLFLSSSLVTDTYINILASYGMGDHLTPCIASPVAWIIKARL